MLLTDGHRWCTAQPAADRRSRLAVGTFIVVRHDTPSSRPHGYGVRVLRSDFEKTSVQHVGGERNLLHAIGLSSTVTVYYGKPIKTQRSKRVGLLLSRLVVARVLHTTGGGGVREKRTTVCCDRGYEFHGYEILWCGAARPGTVGRRRRRWAT